VRHRTGALHVARGRIRRLDLAEDLRLADDQRVEAGGDAEQMARGIGSVMAVEMIGERRRLDAVVLAEEAIDGVDRRLRIADGVDLGAVARRQHDRFVADAARGQRRERRVDPLAREVDGFAELDGRGAVTDADGEQAH